MTNKVYLEEKAKLREEWAGLDKLVDDDVKAFSEKVEVLIKKRPVEEYVDLGSNVIRYHYGGGMKELDKEGESFSDKVGSVVKWTKARAVELVFLGIAGVGIAGAGALMYHSERSMNTYQKYLDVYLGKNLVLSEKESSNLKRELDFVSSEERNWQYQYFTRRLDSLHSGGMLTSFLSLSISIIGAFGLKAANDERYRKLCEK